MIPSQILLILMPLQCRRENGGSLPEDIHIAVTTGGAGSNNHGLDIGMRPVLALGSFVWNDTNGDGTQDLIESGIAGATVTLLDGGGTPITTNANGKDISAGVVTGPDGFYSFEHLLPGDYMIQVRPPTGYTQSPTQVGGAINGSTSTNVSNSDSNIDAANTAFAPAGSYRSGTITLVMNSEPTGETQAGGAADNPNGANNVDNRGNMTVDFGFQTPLMAVGSTVWNDTNGNGTQDSGENGLAGATVYLVDTSGNQVTIDALGNDISAGVTTGPDGYYVFDNLLPGNYYLELVFPVGYAPGVNQNPNPVDNTNTGSEKC